MAKSYSDVLKQIEDLKKEAEELRKNELATVIADLKTTIQKYNITAEDLGLSVKAKRKYTKKEDGVESKPVSTVAPKYQDPSNPENKWSGRGMKPKWFADQLQAGKTKESMEIKS